MKSIKAYSFKTLLSFILLVGTFQTVQAAVDCNTSRCRGPMQEIVTGIFAAQSGDMVFTAAAAIQSLGCTAMYAGQNIILLKSHGGFDETVAVALIAESANRFVTLKRDTTTTDCIIQYIRLGS